VIAGTGTQRSALEALARLGCRRPHPVSRRGRRRRVLDLYAGALGVIFPPYDEDFGYVTLEAFLAGKPVVTDHDAGGPNEFVIDGVNGRVTRPIRKRSARRSRPHLHAIAPRPRRGRLRARARRDLDGVIEHLIGESSPA
jgi:glycosyltransferase involved in cell wall biosynthesis